MTCAAPSLRHGWAVCICFLVIGNHTTIVKERIRNVGRAYRTVAAENERRKCALPGCYEHRYQVSQYCRRHRDKNVLYGHPEAERISWNDLSESKERVSEVINMNLDHPGIQAALQFLNSLLLRAAHGDQSVPCPLLFSRLHSHGVTPLEMLKCAASVWHFGIKEDGRRIKSADHRDIVVGQKIVRIFGFRGRGNHSIGMLVQRKHHREIGQYIRRGLATILLNVSSAAQRKEDEDAQRQRDMYLPLK